MNQFLKLKQQGTNMAEGKLEAQDFEKYLSLSEKEARTAALAANDAFTRAMQKAVKRGREKAKPGTYVDTSPTFARTIRGEAPMSGCGSPGAMCAERGGTPAGAEAMK